MPPSAGRTRSSLPTIHADAIPTAHSSAPDEECQGGKANWPPHPEAQDNQSDPGRFPQFVKPCANVNYIYITTGRRSACQGEQGRQLASPTRQIILPPSRKAVLPRQTLRDAPKPSGLRMLLMQKTRPMSHYADADRPLVQGGVRPNPFR